MRWLVAAAVVGGCSFPHSGAPNANDGAIVTNVDASPSDGTVISDAPSDAESVCHVGVANTTGTDRGRVGGDGGSANFPPLACANPGDRIIGISLRMSDQTTLYGQRSAQGMRIGCASVTVRGSGAVTLGTLAAYEIVGTGGFDWAPSTWTPMTQCKPGWILAGMSTHTSQDDNLFLDVSITCAQIGPTGTVVATEVIYVDGSLNESQGADSASCNSGEIVTRMPNRSGAGLDSVNLFCATPTCS